MGVSMRTILAYACLSLLVGAPAALSQERNYTLAVTGSFTTSSKLFYNIDDPNEIARNQYLSLSNVLGVGIDIRRRIEESGLAVGISVEYISKLDDISESVSSTAIAAVKDGFVVVPIEATGYFTIPFSSERAQMYMGGGAGIYLGARHYQYSTDSARVIDQKPGYGIHILTGFCYRISPVIGLRSELKFRDVQFQSTNVFLPSYVSLPAPNYQPFSSRINIDGMTLTVGLAAFF